MTVDAVFFDRVSHDFRGELATIVAGVHYVLHYDDALSSSARQMLERVAGAGARLKRQLDEFDDAAWLLEHAPRPLSLAPCDMDRVLDTVIERLKGSPRTYCAGVIVEPHPPQTTCVADAELVAVALGYVIDISLARSATEAVRIALKELAGGGIVATVTDSGGPVASEQLDRLLEGFAVFDVLPKPAPGQPRRERLGLGLSIARRIFEAHAGYLRAMSTAGGLALECAVGVSTRP